MFEWDPSRFVGEVIEVKGKWFMHFDDDVVSNFSMWYANRCLERMCFGIQNES